MRKTKFLGILILLLVFLFSFCSLVGCGGSKPNTSSNDQTSQSSGSSESTSNDITSDSPSSSSSSSAESSSSSSSTSSSSSSSEHNHSFSNYVYNNDATCTQDGTETATCPCGEETDTRVVIGTAGHEYTAWIDQVDKTCEKDGVLGHYGCENCEKVFDAEKTELDSLVIPAGHEYTAWIAEVPATTTTTGTKGHYDCKKCDKHFDNQYNEITDLTIPVIVPDVLNYHVASGTLKESNGVITSTSANALALKNDSSFSTGTLSATINLNGQTGDSGIIFNVGRTSDKFWEQEDDVGYYIFFISSRGSAYLAEVIGKDAAPWYMKIDTLLSTTIDRSVPHTLEVSMDASRVIRIYVDGVYYGAHQDTSNRNGTEFGLRTAVSGVAYSEFAVSTEVKMPPTADDLENYTIASGSFSKDGNNIKSTLGSSLAMVKNSSLKYGTIEVPVTLPGTLSDNGILFSVSHDNDLFWEGAGVSFNFFFLNGDGVAVLGRSVNGVWSHLGTGVVSCYNKQLASGTDTYTLKVEVGNGIIKCYVNDIEALTYIDKSPLSGTEYGLRAGVANVSFGTPTATPTDNPITPPVVDTANYQVTNGSFTNTNGVMKSTTGNSLAYVKDSSLKYGYIESTVTLGGVASDNGLIFNLSHNGDTFWETNCSYYFFFLAFGGTAMVGRVDNGNWTTMGWNYAPGYNETTAGGTGTYTLKVVIDDTTISTYVNGTMVLTIADTNPLTGTGYGIRAGGNNVSFGAITCSSTDVAPSLPAPSDLTVKSGNFGVTGSMVKTTGANNIALINTNLTTGTLTAYARGVVAQNKVGVVFNYTDANNYYKFYSSRYDQTVKLAKVSGGIETVLYTNYLSAGYGEGASFMYKVVIQGNKAYCYFFNTLYTTVTLDLSGTGMGIYTEKSGSLFDSYSVNAIATDDIKTTNTLLFGHSYFELWDDWKSDFNLVGNQVEGLGTFHNVGIGGSVAEHWWNFREALLEYKFSKAVYMIGINDISGAYTPAQTAEYVDKLLAYLKGQIPELELVLVGVAHCPARRHITSQISATNDLYEQIVLKYDWVKFAECEYAFCTTDGDANTSSSALFKDELHPTAYAYTTYLVPAIVNAWKGLNQPVESEATLANAKLVKMNAIANYSEYNYRATEWETAKPTYESAVNKINACTTAAQLNSLDLSSEINTLSSIKNNAQYTFDNLMAASYINDGSNYSTYLWEENRVTDLINSSSNGVYKYQNFGHRLDSSVTYTDMSFTFKLSDFNADVGLKGILFRSRQDFATRSISGYLINYVSNANQQYLQILYLQNAYGVDGTPNSRSDYMGGWVFPGQVGGTEFRAVVSGNVIKLYTEADYQAYGENGVGCAVDLTNLNGTGTVAPYTDGHFGIITWDNAYANYEIKNLAGSAVATAEARKAQQLTAQALAGTNCTTAGTQEFKNTINTGTSYLKMAGKGFTALTNVTHTNATFSFSVDAGTDVLNSGIILRGSLSADGLGINGIMVNVHQTSTEWFIQVFELVNAFRESAPAEGQPGEGYNYMGGIVMPQTSVGTKFNVVLNGSSISVTADNNPAITITITAENTLYPFTTLGSGFIAFAHNHEGGSAALKLHSITLS